MQWANCPSPIKNVSAQITITEPLIECEADTSHATNAMTQPAMTALQKIESRLLSLDSGPNCASLESTSGLREGVSTASAAKAPEPAKFEVNTTHQSRRVRAECLRSARARATG